VLKLLKSIFSGDLIKSIIDNFDPHGINKQIDIEFNNKYNEELKLKNKEK
jgi:hypothetical protein